MRDSFIPEAASGADAATGSCPSAPLTVEEARAAGRRARAALLAIEAERREALAAASAVFDERVRAAHANIRAAEHDIRVAENAATHPHPLEGRLANKLKFSSTRFGRSPSPPVVAATGVIFTYRHGVDLGTMPGWRRPALGDPLVRHLKKDGTPGARVENFTHEWVLADGAREAASTTDQSRAPGTNDLPQPTRSEADNG